VNIPLSSNFRYAATMSNFDLETEQSDLCTFALSHRNMLHQAIYICRTCSGKETSGVCCCSGCSNVCHDGHDVDFLAFGNAYCDCGADGGCVLIDRSIIASEKLLGNRSGSGVVVDHALFSTLNRSVFSEHSISTIKNARIGAFLRAQSSLLVTFSKETFWLSCESTPSCAFEQLARHVFDTHVENAAISEFDRSSSGAEWWVQVKPLNSPTDSLLESASDGFNGIDLHYDKDEEIASTFEIGIFPLISTVTYLNDDDSALPTVVFETTAATPVGDPIRRCIVSRPALGKHIAFDGKLLHGAPSEFSMFSVCNDFGNGHQTLNVSATSKSTLPVPDNFRVTILVNIWLNHHPAAVQRIPLEIVSALSTQLNAMDSDSRKEIISAMEGLTISNVSCAQPFNYDEVIKRPKRKVDEILSIGMNSKAEGENSMGIPRFMVAAKDTKASAVIEEGKAPGSNDEGQWTLIPFISDKSQWGKTENETGVSLKMYVPHNVQYLARLNQKALTNTATNRLQNGKKQSASSSLKKMQPSGKGSSTSSSAISGSSAIKGNPVDASMLFKLSSFTIEFETNDCAARLEYEDDNEYEDDLMNDLAASSIATMNAAAATASAEATDL
jgi:hypothetical protein